VEGERGVVELLELEDAEEELASLDAVLADKEDAVNVGIKERCRMKGFGGCEEVSCGVGDRRGWMIADVQDDVERRGFEMRMDLGIGLADNEEDLIEFGIKGAANVP